MQLRSKRQQPAIYFRPDTGIADFGMHFVGKINRCRPTRQRDQFALRRKTEDLILKEIKPGMFEKFVRVRGVLDDIEQLSNPLIIPCFG